MSNLASVCGIYITWNFKCLERFILWRGIIFGERYKIYSHFPFLNNEKAQIEDMYLPGFQRADYGKYHGCWWADDTKNRGVSSHSVGVVLPDHWCLSTGNEVRHNIRVLLYAVRGLCWAFAKNLTCGWLHHQRHSKGNLSVRLYHTRAHNIYNAAEHMYAHN